MANIYEFCKQLTDSDWEKLSADIAEIGKDEQKDKAFSEKYGFKSSSIRGYELQHYIELERRNKMLAEQKAELLKGTNQGFPPIRPMKGECVKCNLYATQSSLDAFNKMVDDVVELYGFRRYHAVAFLLEEMMKRIGPVPKE